VVVLSASASGVMNKSAARIHKDFESFIQFSLGRLVHRCGDAR
jgi:hypothetical protein